MNERIKMNDIIEKSKEYFLGNTGEKISVKAHVMELEKWGEKVLKDYPEANREILMVSVWLHDIGYFVGEKEIDHAIKSEVEADKFLTKENVAEDIKKQILHCIRAHRNNDVKPETLEAKLLAGIDSASHLTGTLYMFLFNYGKNADYILPKIERDYRDLEPFPEIKKMLSPVYEDWKKLIKSLDNIEL